MSLGVKKPLDDLSNGNLEVKLFVSNVINPLEDKAREREKGKSVLWTLYLRAARDMAVSS